MASWLVRSAPDRVVLGCVVFLGKTLYSHGASLQPGVQMGTGESNAGSNPAMNWHPIQEGVEILLVASCYRNLRYLYNSPRTLLLTQKLLLNNKTQHFVTKIVYRAYTIQATNNNDKLCKNC